MTRKSGRSPEWDCGREQTFQSRPRLLFGGQLDAAILSAALGRLVGRDEVGLAVSGHPQLGGMDSATQQVVGDGVGAALGQMLVVVHTADNVAVTVDVDDDRRILLQDRDGLIQHGGVTRADIRLVEVEMHSAQHQLLRRRRRWWRRRRRRWWRWRRRWRRGRGQQIANDATDYGASRNSRCTSNCVSLRTAALERCNSASAASTGDSVLGIRTLLRAPRRARRSRQQSKGRNYARPIFPL